MCVFSMDKHIFYTNFFNSWHALYTSVGSRPQLLRLFIFHVVWKSLLPDVTIQLGSSTTRFCGVQHIIERFLSN